MKLQSFSQFINESVLVPGTSTLNSSKISAGLISLISDEDKDDAKTYFNVDYNTLMQTAAPKVVGIMNTLADKINDPNFNPNTLPAAVDQFEKEIYPLVTQTVDSIMDNLENATLRTSLKLVTVRTALNMTKGILKNKFLKNNAEDKPFGPISNIVRSVINIMMDNLKPDLTIARATQTQIIKNGNPVPPFTLTLSNGTPKTYGQFMMHPSLSHFWYAHGTKKGQPYFKDGSKKDGCYNIDYWHALSDLLADRAPKITQQIAKIIQTRVFS